MIGKSLRERHTLAPLSHEAATAAVTEMLTTHAEPLVQVRARDARMVACLVARADEASVRLCKSLGFRVALGGALVFGLLGADAARLLSDGARVGVLTEAQRTWLTTPCGPRETKLVLFAGGLAFVSLEAKDGEVTIVVH
jgi:hypothetical protein